MPKHPHGCPRHHELDVYPACSYGCRYCVTEATPRRRVEGIVDEGAITELVRSRIAAHPSWPWYLSPWTDPYPAEEETRGLTRRVLQELHRADAPFFVVTKGIGVIRDATLFDDDSRRFVAISLATLDDALARRLEPDTPLPSARMDVVEQLVARGTVRVVVKVDPVIPGLTDGARLDDVLSWLSDVRPFGATFETARLTTGLATTVAEGLTEHEAAEVLAAYPVLDDQPRHPDAGRRHELLASIADTMAAHGLRASFCRATNEVAYSPYDCRGGYDS